MKIRTYSELIILPTFEDRFEYLRLTGDVGIETFGFDRYVNQVFYRSPEWKRLRREIFIRDNGCDLAFEGHEIFGNYIVHHMNPISLDDILNREDYIMNPEYLITTRLLTHNAIHYSNLGILDLGVKERYMNDTCPWR